MQIHVVQHVPFEGPASFADWALDRRHQLTTTRLYQGDALPEIDDSWDWLLVMGGPMNVYEEARYPWLAAEKAFIGRAIAAGKTVIGVCLGAQLIAAALGARVRRAIEKEIGWFPVDLTRQGRDSLFGDVLPERFVAFHWHGDTFDIPAGAPPLASSAVCPNQAFLYQGRVLGLQLHMEVTPESVAHLLAHCGDELVPGRYVQTAAAIQAGAAHCMRLKELLWRLIDRLPMPASITPDA